MEGAKVKEVCVHVQLESKRGSFSCFMCCLAGKSEEGYLLGVDSLGQRLINHVQKSGCLARTGWAEDSKHELFGASKRGFLEGGQGNGYRPNMF